MIIKLPTMMGTLTRCQPAYIPIMMKYKHYEECFRLPQNWTGFITFTKNIGIDTHTPFIHISSVITMEQSSISYSEQFDYMLIQHTHPSVVIHHFWKKNKQIILPNEIPNDLFKILSQKHCSDTIYSSNPTAF